STTTTTTNPSDVPFTFSFTIDAWPTTSVSDTIRKVKGVESINAKVQANGGRKAIDCLPHSKIKIIYIGSKNKVYSNPCKSLFCTLSPSHDGAYSMPQPPQHYGQIPYNPYQQPYQQPAPQYQQPATQYQPPSPQEQQQPSPQYQQPSSPGHNPYNPYQQPYQQPSSPGQIPYNPYQQPYQQPSSPGQIPYNPYQQPYQQPSSPGQPSSEYKQPSPGQES